MGQEWSDFLGKIGIASQSIERIKLGKGVVGKMATIAMVAIIALAAISWKLSWKPLACGAVILIFILSIYVIVIINRIARDHPDIALLEGAEFLAFHNKIPFGAKNLHSPPKNILLQSDPTLTNVPMLEEPTDEVEETR